MQQCRERTRLLIGHGNEEALQMAKEIKANYLVEWILRPQEGLAMIKVRETARQTLFYLGEVLITETKVRIRGSIGLGILTGSHPDLSEALAVVDAAYRAGLPETGEWDRYWDQILEKEKVYKKINLAIREKTSVNFSTMQD